MQKEEEKQNCSKLAETYYDSDSGFRFYSIINSPDYSGLGLYPSEQIETDPQGEEYPRGDGLGIREATMARDKKMLDLILANAPDKKLKILECGSGRGGFARYLSKELLKNDKLEQMIATNISQRENDFNLARGREEGLTEAQYLVQHVSFDDLSCFSDGLFDVISCNDSFLHSANKTACMESIARILAKDGCLVFSDLLENPQAPKDKLTPIYDRLSLDSLGSVELYTKVLNENGLKTIETFLDTRQLQRHYGMVKYSALVIKKDELMGEEGITQEFYDKQVNGLGKWIDAGEKDIIQWGWFVFKKE